MAQTCGYVRPILMAIGKIWSSFYKLYLASKNEIEKPLWGELIRVLYCENTSGCSKIPSNVFLYAFLSVERKQVSKEKLHNYVD